MSDWSTGIISDTHRSVDANINTMMYALNDELGESPAANTLRGQFFPPWIDTLIGTATNDPAVQRARTFKLADQLCRVFLPKLLRHLNHDAAAKKLEALQEVTNRETAYAARNAVNSARNAALNAAADVAYDAASAAANASQAAAADAANAAAYAAASAAAHAAAHAAASAAANAVKAAGPIALSWFDDVIAQVVLVGPYNKWYAPTHPAVARALSV